MPKISLLTDGTGLTLTGAELFPFVQAGVTYKGTINQIGTRFGLGTYAIGDLLYASSASLLSRLAAVAVGSILVSGGVGAAPAWSTSPNIINNQNGVTTVTVTNTSAGISAAADYNASNGTGSAAFGIAGTGYTTISALQNRAFVFGAGPASGIVLWSASATGPIIFGLNSVELARFTPGGPLQITPTAASLSQGLSITQSSPSTGSTAGPFSFNEITATNQISVTGAGIDASGIPNTNTAALRVRVIIGGGTSTGQGIEAGLFNAQYTGGVSVGDKIGLVGTIYSTVNDSAVGGGGGLFAMNAYAVAGSGANNDLLIGIEATVKTLAGGTVANRWAVLAASNGDSTSATTDAAYVVASTKAAGVFSTMFLITKKYGFAPLQTTADIFACKDSAGADVAATVANVFNFPSLTVSTNILNFPNAILSGAGALTTRSANLGPTVTPSSGVILTVNGNTVAPAALINTGVLLQISGADGTNPFLMQDAFGTGVTNFLVLRRARGTAASYTAAQSGDNLGFFAMIGASAANTFPNSNGTGGGIFFGGTASENWDSTHRGAELRLYTTPNTTAAVALAATIQNSGGISIGSSSDPGTGGLFVNVGLGVGTNVTTTSFFTLAAGTTAKSALRFIQGAAPTSPVDGDVWREDNTNTGLKVRINGVTKTFTVA